VTQGFAPGSGEEGSGRCVLELWRTMPADAYIARRHTSDAMRRNLLCCSPKILGQEGRIWKR